MEQNRPKQTDQQATNAALAALAAAGNSFALGQLWEVNKGFVRRQLWQWYEKNKPVADNAGLSFEDLVQEGYFAVDYAAKHYSAEQGSFTTYLSYALLKQIRTATCGEHTRGVITEDGRRVAVSANPLNECTSLDTLERLFTVFLNVGHVLTSFHLLPGGVLCGHIRFKPLPNRFHNIGVQAFALGICRRLNFIFRGAGFFF